MTWKIQNIWAVAQVPPPPPTYMPVAPVAPIFPRENLARDEQVLFETRPRLIAMIMRGIIQLIIVSAVIFPLMVVFASWDVCWSIGLIVWFLFGLLPIILACIAWRYTAYALTNKRALLRHGVLSRHIVDSPHSSIVNVVLHQTFLERIFRCGTVIFSTAAAGAGMVSRRKLLGLGVVMWWALPEPVEVRRRVQEIIDESTKVAKMAEFQQMAAAFRGQVPGGPMQPPQQPPAQLIQTFTPTPPPQQVVYQVTIRCPTCNNTFGVPSAPRPLEIICPKCGTKGLLR